MRAIILILLWALLLIIINAYDPFRIKLEDLYLKEYYTRLLYIFKDKILRNIDSCNNASFINEMNNFYKNYKIEGIKAIVGFWTTVKNQSYCHQINGSMCFCVYEEFSRVIVNESFEVENLRTISIDNKIFLWYYR